MSQISFRQGTIENLEQDTFVEGALYLAKNGSEAYLYYGETNSNNEQKKIPITTKGLDDKYVNISGDTMTGKLGAHGGISLNNTTSSAEGLTYILGIKSFAEGGDVIYSTASDISVGHASGADTAARVTNSLIINGKTYNGSSVVDVETMGVPYGGTGKTSWIANGIVYAVNSTALGQLGVGTSGWVLTSGGTSNAPSWTQVASSNQSSTIVKRNSNGDFSARIINAESFNGNATSATTASKLGTDAGSSTKPVYFKDGIPKDCGTSLAVDITGNATTAGKLNTDAGSSTKPVYFENGIPVDCGASLAVNITGNAATASSATSATVATKAEQDIDGNAIKSTYLKLSGGTMAGTLTLFSNQNTDAKTSTALNANNSNITGVNSIFFADESDGYGEGIHFAISNDDTKVDTLLAKQGVLYFFPSRTLGSQSTTNRKVVLHSGNYTNYTVTKTGTGATGHWGISVDSATSATNASSVPWTGVSGKPSTFTPSAHDHSYIRLELNADDNNKQNSIGGYIDFHFRDSSGEDKSDNNKDYSSRICEYSKGTLTINGITVSDSTITGSLNGNATSATSATQADKLTTSRNINGTAFNGTQDITTAQWGTARTISINSSAGTTGTSVNGSKNVSLVIPTTLSNFVQITSEKFIGDLQGNATSATTASKLGTNAGSSTQPIYFSGGVPTACGTSLAVSITGNAATATKATQDGDGNVIKSTYLKLSGGTMTGKLRMGESTQSGMTQAVGIHVHDLRSATITPSTFGDQSVNFIFDNRLGTSDWRSAIQVKGWTGEYTAWQLSGGASTAVSNKLYYREGVKTSWGTWYSIPFENRENTFTALNKFTGNVEISNLLAVASGASHYGVKIGDTYINAIGGQLIFQNNTAIRFGGDNWDYNVWAGLKYVHSSKTVFLGLADNVQFTANAAQSGGTLALPGIRYLSINGKIAIDAVDSWLRINENKTFSSGIYTGTSIIRTDERLEVGSNGAKFYAAKDGTGYFDNDVKVKGHVFAYNYTRDGNDAPSLIFDKNGSHLTGIGSHNIADTIWFGAVDTDTHTWVTSYYQNWYFNGNIEAAKQFRRVGISSSWYNGRDNAALRVTTSSGYSVLASMKTTNGSWDIGNYNHANWHDTLLFNYKSDTSYANGSSDNTVVHAAKLSNAGYLTLLSGLSATSGTFSGKVTLSGTTAAASQIYFGRGDASYFASATGGFYCFVPNGQAVGTANSDLIISDGYVYPGTNNATSLGKSSYRWSTVYTQRLIAYTDQDAAYNAANSVALITGSPTGTHLEFDGNEIFAKTSGTAAGTLYLQSGSGDVEIASGGQTTIGTKAVFKNNAAGGFNFAGRIDVGCLLLTNSGWTGYGTGDPSSLTAATGRVYFKIIE